MVPASMHPASYTVVDFHIQASEAQPLFLNNRGTVVGRGTPNATQFGPLVMFIIRGGKETVFPPDVVRAAGLNNADQVALETRTGVERWSPSGQSMRILAGKSQLTPAGIDSRGELVWISAFQSSTFSVRGWPWPWNAPDRSDLIPTIIGADGTFCATKRIGDVPAPGPPPSPGSYYFDGKQYLPIGGPPNLLQALCISPNDWIGGTGNGGTTPFLWRKGKVTILPVHAGGKSQALVKGVNSSGVAVGYANWEEPIPNGETQRVHAVMWNQGKMIDLNDLIPSTFPYELDEAVAINDSGQILATAEVKDPAHFLRPTLVLLNPIVVPVG